MTDKNWTNRRNPRKGQSQQKPIKKLANYSLSDALKLEQSEHSYIEFIQRTKDYLMKETNYQDELLKKAEQGRPHVFSHDFSFNIEEPQKISKKMGAYLQGMRTRRKVKTDKISKTIADVHQPICQPENVKIINFFNLSFAEGNTVKKSTIDVNSEVREWWKKFEAQQTAEKLKTTHQDSTRIHSGECGANSSKRVSDLNFLGLKEKEKQFFPMNFCVSQPVNSAEKPVKAAHLFERQSKLNSTQRKQRNFKVAKVKTEANSEKLCGWDTKDPQSQDI